MKKLKRCSHCGKKKKDVKLQTNPYESDVNGDYTKELLCDDCVDELCQEI